MLGWLKQALTQGVVPGFEGLASIQMSDELRQRVNKNLQDKSKQILERYIGYTIASLRQVYGMSTEKIVEAVGVETLRKVYGKNYQEWIENQQKYILQPGEYNTAGVGTGRGATESVTMVLTFNLFKGEGVDLDTLKAEVTDGVLKLLYALGYS